MAQHQHDQLESRRRRLQFRVQRRGTREMDFILTAFAAGRVAGFDEAGLAAFEALLDLPDPDLFAWVNGLETPPPEQDTPLLRDLIAFHRIAASAAEIPKA